MAKEKDIRIANNTINEMKNKIINLSVGEHIQFEMHDYFDRKKMKEFAKENNIKYSSFINNCIQKTYDSTLIIHHNCNKATPYNSIKWYDDIGICNTYMGCYFICAKCKGHVHSQYENNKNSVLGYTEHKGKNCMEFWK